MNPFINMLVKLVILLHIIELNATKPPKKYKSLSEEIYPNTHIIDGPIEPPGFERNLPEQYIYQQSHHSHGWRGSPSHIIHHGGPSGQGHQGHQPRSPSAFRPFSGNQQPRIQPGTTSSQVHSFLPQPPSDLIPPSDNEPIYRPIAQIPKPPGPQ